MKYFVKAKFPPVQSDTAPVVPVRKQRVDDRNFAFELAAQWLDDGATSITIRPEQ